ncbi:MAG: hypothetical protein EA358_05240 [Flavobacteriales bacterium]|nr:MAG: hypothetical protein EA358_05240 [Flavobacteriales bacterium]
MGDYALALVADESYLDYTKQVFVAARRQGCWSEDLLLIAHEISQDKLEWFIDQGVIVHHAQPIIFSKPQENKAATWPLVVYAKLNLFHPEFSRWKKIIYLDTDVLIRKDIRGLLEFNHFAAARESLNAPLEFQFVPDEVYLSAQHKKLVKNLGVDLGAPSFNVGVMLIASQTNTPQQFEALCELANRMHGLAYFPEQAVLNVFFQRRWAVLPYAYNDLFVHDWFVPRKNDHDSVILHLVGKPKPWESTSPYHTEWLANFRRANDLSTLKPIGVRPTQLEIANLDARVQWWIWLGKLGLMWWRLRRYFVGNK